MPAGIRAALRDIVEKYGGKTEEDAKEFVARMEREGRLDGVGEFFYKFFFVEWRMWLIGGFGEVNNAAL